MRLFFVTAFMFLYATSASSQKVKYDSGDNGRKLDWAFYYLDNYYVDSTDIDHLAEVALRAIAKELDPWSRYDPPKKAKAQKDRDNGIKEVGIGIKYYLLQDTAVITSVAKESSAQKAGVQRGDMILGIDGKDVVDSSWDSINEMLKGEKGTDVKLSLLRNNNFAFDISMPRATVPYESLVGGFMIDDNIAYLKFNNFNKRTIPEFNTYTAALNPKHFIIDLRDNTGGTLDSSIELADQFLAPDKLIVYSQGYNMERKDYHSTIDGKYHKAKVVILVDEYSMSASEVFTAALQDHDRCLIIGTNTKGKALIQRSYRLGDGSNLRITVGRYYTPTGRLIQRDYDAESDWLSDNVDLIGDDHLTSTLDVPQEYRSKTNGNRAIISGHGGIAPDIYMEYFHKRDDYYITLNKEGLVYGFVTWYVRHNREQLLKRFPLSKAFMDNKSVNNEIDIAFTKYVERKHKSWNLDIVLKPIPTTPRTMLQIKSWMGTQIWGTDAYYMMFKENDTLIKTAKSAINGDMFSKIGVR